MTAPSQQHSDELEADLRQYELVKHGSYDKRTEYLNADGYGLFINRLIREDSPYLLQHAHNLVNWFPWGDEAFACARAQNKPVFLSIGYATCHWCHVMEVESFDNPAVAAVLNEHFISVKMDREQYPDIDEIYMTGVQGVSVVNALSEALEVKVKRDSQEFQIDFSNGDKVNELKKIGEVGLRNTGTSITFKPNPEYFEDINVQVKRLKHLLKAKAVLCPGRSFNIGNAHRAIIDIE